MRFQTIQTLKLLPLAVLGLVATAEAEQWVPVASTAYGMTLQYSKESVRPVTATIAKARVRLIAEEGGELPRVGVLSVVTELEYHCVQPLEKVLSVEVLDVRDSTPLHEDVESPVFGEIRHGSNSFMLWGAVCSQVRDPQ